MSLLSAVQDASVRLIGEQPDAIFSADDPFALEMQSLANEVAKDIAKSHDWQALIAIHTLMGDGSTTAFALPANYDRMLLDSRIYDETNWAWGYERVVRTDDWLELKVRDFGLINPGVWTLFQNRLQFLPAPSDGREAKFVYITNEIVTPANGNDGTHFADDNDEFVLSERLLTLALVWRWREMKRLEYAADQANFEKAFSDISGKDGGARPIRSYSATRHPRGRFAYPFGELG